MGSIVQGQCFIASQDAYDLFYGTIPVFQSSNLVSTFLVSHFKSAAPITGWSKLVEEYPLAGGALIASNTTNAPAVIFPTCDPVENFTDGVTVGWGIGSALILVAAIKLMKKAT